MQSYYPARASYKSGLVSINLKSEICAQIGLFEQTSQNFKMLYCQPQRVTIDEQRIIILPVTNCDYNNLFELEVALLRETGSTAAICGFLAALNINIEWCQAIDSLFNDSGLITFIVNTRNEYIIDVASFNKHLKDKIDAFEYADFKNKLNTNKTDYIKVTRKLNEQILSGLDVKKDNIPIKASGNNKKETISSWDPSDSSFNITLSRDLSNLVLSALGDGTTDPKYFFVTVIVDSISKSISLVLKSVDELIVSYLITMKNRPAILYQLLNLFTDRNIDLRVIEPRSLDSNNSEYLIAGKINESPYEYFSVKTLEHLIIGDLLFNNQFENIAELNNISRIKRDEIKIEAVIPFLCLSGRKLQEVFNLIFFQIYQGKAKYFSVDLEFESVFYSELLQKENINLKLIEAFGYDTSDIENLSWKQSANLSLIVDLFENHKEKEHSEIVELFEEGLETLDNGNTSFTIDNDQGEKYQYSKLHINHLSLFLLSAGDVTFIIAWTFNRDDRNIDDIIKNCCLALFDHIKRTNLDKKDCLYYFLSKMVMLFAKQESIPPPNTAKVAKEVIGGDTGELPSD